MMKKQCVCICGEIKTQRVCGDKDIECAWRDKDSVCTFTKQGIKGSVHKVSSVSLLSSLCAQTNAKNLPCVEICSTPRGQRRLRASRF